MKQRNTTPRNARQGEARNRALHVLADLRRGEASFTELCEHHGIDPRTARKYLGRDLIGKPGERVRPSKSDSRTRELMFPSEHGDFFTKVRGSKNATLIGQYFSDRGKLLVRRMSEAEFEAKWRGITVQGAPILADVSKIRELAEAGLIQVESLYRSKGGAR